MDKALIFFAKSRYADLFGVALVIAIAIGSGYLNTNLAKYVNWGPMTSLIPFGVISVINVGISMMSTRLTGRLSNIGNVLGIINTALSGAIDYILGNKAAIITYPVTFIVYTFAIRRWQNSERGKAMEPPTGAKGRLVIAACELYRLRRPDLIPVLDHDRGVWPVPVGQHSERTEADDAVAVLGSVQHRAVREGADSG